ncbi:hypothetical protein A2454_02720 [Candidatus Peribacteria bacterium RIFOXYC2_FULL_55_14]|nr:MAG: hypothetical protein A2384_04045 [Candidatus Peribacteria bacterium RIFOXYB1_FULL_54_35]OGJ74850.1 MAG: hypothetical protein A2217_02515 [Candidatus Peribacteria bacterium RIFOXYA2_FULL_55_28]OGJ77138.1 MAG: hypothetical protein A2327_05620 [Candidatus Peribacteria bacterium RIFOXYB2_FULL_54_17]OGJ78572.1 MAG: hypothetical protein A2424_06610 [Candidatus Peribacteria bacterium RIFOXYC1_FULL_54_13]OGJ79792.1 MAG: hypothetical protein A2454_02720 [Candidatus Peribacteria bacterium RIFOXYC
MFEDSGLRCEKDVLEFDVRVAELSPDEAFLEMRRRLHALLPGETPESVDVLWDFVERVEEGRAAYEYPGEEEEYLRRLCMRENLRLMLQWPVGDLQGYCDEVRGMVLEQGLGSAMLTARCTVFDVEEKERADSYLLN